MKRFFLVILALAAMAPAMLFRLMGWDSLPLVNTAVFGVAVLAADFMLSWGVEAAESYISQGLILAVVALITVLPEYAIDMYYAFQAGRAPESNYVHYAAANMTGANRLLVGLAWPLIMLLHWWRTRERAIPLAPANIIEILFLFIASLYAFVTLLKNRIDLLDFVVLVSIFGAYFYGRSAGFKKWNPTITRARSRARLRRSPNLSRLRNGMDSRSCSDRLYRNPDLSRAFCQSNSGVWPGAGGR